ncbi:hypothetical protein P280DRAFT_456638 [Massarina eburnea CBS 473.64]|uniref:Endosomal peripheral membrane protein-like protein n=1 Tax=Massarina eburnea CBS 473.64 TaxID=1395130 RepID=A0A6A6RU86_9PLEO|nr:hypothetical protein P280DRAFT_456638 [Massarina eburnea CBS 473.64]
MTAQILAAELGNLIQDSKRKNTELRSAADKALQDLKSLPVTSEAQLSADLSRRPHFITPFLIACSTHNAKFSSTGVSCLQRLGVSRALPRERLTEVLDAFKECVSLSHEVQLKILQSLPSLVQNYPAEIRSDLLSTVLQISSSLQNVKNFAVSNTAAATLQQLVITVFDRVTAEDDKLLEIPTITEVQGGDGPISVRPAAHDAYKVFNDLSLLITGEKPAFIRFSSIPTTSTLEVIESVLSNHGKIMTTHAEQVHLLRSLLMPTIISSLSERLSFPTTLRIIRILNLIIRNHLNIMPSECEIALGLLNHMLDPEASTLWKRALCLEVFRGIYSDPRLLLQIYSHYDRQEGKKDIFGDNLASFVRLSTEKPALIGLGQQSTLPMRSDKDSSSEQAVAEADALAGVISGPVTETSSTVHAAGISSQWSTMKTACIEHLDKSEPPHLPETYVYSLVLTCITNVSESLAKFVLPLTVHHESKRKKNKGEEASKPDSEPVSAPARPNVLSRTQSFRKKTIPINPLDLEEHPNYEYIQTSATLVMECWPAVLATCSTFLNAALDADYYRALVRAIQKFTQVAGLLRLPTPRDAFLTTMGKAAVPSSMLLANVASPKSPPADYSAAFSNAKALLSVDSFVSQTSSISEKNQRPARDAGLPALGPRNLLCLRALLNLAIALGPTLQTAWSIVFETLQVADLVMAISNQGAVRAPSGPVTRPEADTSSEKVEAETSAVQAAARRLFESTVDFPNESFAEVLQALCALIHDSNGTISGDRTPTNGNRHKVLRQRRLGSVSGISLKTEGNSRDSAFALNKIGELAAINEERLAHFDPSDSGWDTLITELVGFSADVRKAPPARLLSADILARTVKEIAELSVSDDEREEVQARIISALRAQISALHQDDRNNEEFYNDTDIRIHQIALEALQSVIEKCGESLIAGWVSVFDCLLSVFTQSSLADRDSSTSVKPNGQVIGIDDSIEVISKSLARTAFATVQLVCSDFLGAVPNTSLATLLELLQNFSSQQDDLNMSLTAVTFFWNVSDFLHARSDLSQLPDILGNVEKLEDVRRAVKSKSQEGNISALWLQVPLNLSVITTDRRAELRNTSIQTIQRIFENYVDQLSSISWMLCLRTVLFGMVEANLAVQKSIHGEGRPSPEDLAAWNDTTKTVLDSVSNLISMYMDKIEDASRLGEAWSDLLDYFQQYFLCGSHALGASVFDTITKVLSRIEDPQMIGSDPLLKTATVWKEYFNHRDAWKRNEEKNQDAFVAYAQAFKAIYRLADRSLDAKDVTHMLGNIEACIAESDEVPYSSDLDTMTDLQKLGIECFSIVRSDGPGLPEFIIRTLSSFVVLPYSLPDGGIGRRGPTFVALSKAAMSSLKDVTIKHVADEAIYTSGAFLATVQSLEKPIREKYVWQREGKAPAIWQKATTTALDILGPSLTVIDKLKADKFKGDDLHKVWEYIVKMASGITHAQVSSLSSLAFLKKDEKFDIDAFTKLRTLITLSLGSPSLPDALRRTYTRTLFETSVLHDPSPGEIPDLASAPLEALYKIRLGRTDDPEPTLRSEMSYVCTTELFTLLSAHPNTSPERVKLAQAVAPYLILRAALPLRAYIADHPLRGRLPQPESQRRELLFILGELGALESVPEAIPEAPGVRSEGKKHLHRLYPLLVSAVKVARGDGDVFDALVALADVVGAEFGVLDDE